MPAARPLHAGAHAHAPSAEDISSEGSSSDHTDAATMTPEANPNSPFCSSDDISPRASNTKAAPITVPRKGTETMAKSSIQQQIYDLHAGHRASALTAMQAAPKRKRPALIVPR
jgi:hypothetical protein